MKEEVYRVARRHGAGVRIVANGSVRVPREPGIERVRVSDAFDAADDWIAERAAPGTIVVTADILLADRCVKAGATVLAHDGRAFDRASIGHAVAMRALMADLRAMEAVSGGPKPFAKADRSRFLSALDEAVTRILRAVTKP